MNRLNVEETTREHFARIHRAALVLCGNPWDADDLAQETFMLVANQSGGNVLVFRINQDTGELQPTEASVQVANPVCVRFMEIK